MKFITKEEVDSNGVKHQVVQCIYETEEELREAEEESRWWEENGCHCEEAHPTHYIPDGVSKVCEKHHYVCSKCNKIVQIG